MPLLSCQLATPLTSTPDPIASIPPETAFKLNSSTDRDSTVFQGSIMPESHGAQIPKKNVRIQCGKYLIRTLREDDASDRWASWMSDPEAMYLLNSPAQSWTKN